MAAGALRYESERLGVRAVLTRSGRRRAQLERCGADDVACDVAQHDVVQLQPRQRLQLSLADHAAGRAGDGPARGVFDQPCAGGLAGHTDRPAPGRGRCVLASLEPRRRPSARSRRAWSDRHRAIGHQLQISRVARSRRLPECPGQQSRPSRFDCSYITGSHALTVGATFNPGSRRSDYYSLGDYSVVLPKTAFLLP